MLGFFYAIGKRGEEKSRLDGISTENSRLVRGKIRKLVEDGFGAARMNADRAISRDRIPPVTAEEYAGTRRGLSSQETDERKW